MILRKTLGVALVIGLVGAGHVAAAQEPAPAVIPVVQQQGEPAEGDQLQADATGAGESQAGASGAVFASPPPPPAPETTRSTQCSAQRPERRGFELLLIPFDVGRQGLRALRGIFTSC